MRGTKAKALRRQAYELYVCDRIADRYRNNVHQAATNDFRYLYQALKGRRPLRIVRKP